MSVEENKRLMKTLDDALKGQDRDTFNKRQARRLPSAGPASQSLCEEDVRTKKRPNSFRNVP